MDIKQSILQGMTLGEIGVKMGVSRQRVHQICKAKNINVKALIEERERLVVEQIKNLASQGLAIGEIANKLKMSYCQVQGRVQKQKIKCKIKHGMLKQ